MAAEWRKKTDATNLKVGRDSYLKMIDGIPWARPPSWVDPQRRWTRNTFHHAKTRAAQLGTKLRLPGLGPPGTR